LAVVAFAMVLLPILYLALIVLAAWLVVLHLRYDTWMLERGSGRSGFWQLLLYLTPAMAGGILVFFMVKPFFARRAKAPELITLDPTKEPLLFAFVRRICSLVGAPEPSRIDVDCQVNASASLRRGVLSRDLVLTIGLPLVSGLDMRQFAGVLAHEFGHFAQGAGMRLTYLIRHINFWFARVVYERDQWDLKLEQAARDSDWRIMIVLQMARGCVWVTRRILWGLMHAGTAISCFMLRQMEYDADSYEAKVAGSDAFEETASRLRVLNVATQMAYEDVRQSWASRQLPEDLPLLIGHKAGTLPDEVHQKLADSTSSAKTGWLDTHPCDADRVQECRRLKEPGVFRLKEPAMGLFGDFAAVSKAVTRHQYQKFMELEFTEQNLMPAAEILRESAANAETDALVRKYYGGVNVSLRPLLLLGGLPPLAPHEDAAASWREAREAMDSLRPEAEKVSAECLQMQGRLVDFNAAHCLARTGFRLRPEEFGLPATATSVGEQEADSLRAIGENATAIEEGLKKLDPFMIALRQRVTLMLRQARPEGDSSQANSGDQLQATVQLLAAVGAEMHRAQNMGSKLRAFALLAQNRGNHSDPGQVDRTLADLAAELQSHVRGIQERLQGFPYPFSHARGPLTVAEYARTEQTADNEWVRAYLDAGAHVERLFALHYRLLGRVLAYANKAEKRLGN
jgi:Zn-dependent protease with chaperone function